MTEHQDHELEELLEPKVDPAIRHRNPALLLGLLGYLEEVGPDPVPWNELVEVHSGRYRWKTVENALYDLEKFGATSRSGRPGRRSAPDTRAVRLTPLGLAWLRQTVLPLPGSHDDEPLEEVAAADELAEHLADELELEGIVHRLEHEDDER